MPPKTEPPKPRYAHSPKSFPNKLRILGGMWRGRVLHLSPTQELRPTTSHNREMLFNWLGPKIIGARCLDLYAGSGALGIEALSRGAAWVTFIDSAPHALQVLRAQLVAWLKGAEPLFDTQTLVLPESRWTPSQPYDLVFIDPPFRYNLGVVTLTWLENKKKIKPDTLVFLEVEAEHPALDLKPAWGVLKHVTRGQVTAYLLIYHGES
jgi:16S rRNA (guanine966-N2)-methyltransferase